MKNIYLLLLVFFAASCTCKKTTELNIIPKPLKVEISCGEFQFDSKTKIHIDNSKFEESAQFLNEYFSQSSDIQLERVKELSGSNLVIVQTDKKLVKDEYKLDIQKDKIYITASSASGVYYAIQSIRQLLPKEIEAKTVQNIEWKVPTCTIQDRPRFRWRGLHHDVSRHFFSVETIKKEIDLISLHKLNVFHWHLIDDQGWRIEIKKYPKLTSVAAWRADKEHLDWGARGKSKPTDKATYGGFYTQEQIKEVVAYAQKRHVTVVPEIEMPAHVMCAIAAYPHLSCTGKKIGVPSGSVWPITEIYCPGKESTFKFLEDVLSEVIELFPSKYIHIGGDEANKKEWKQCKKCQKRIKDEKLKDEHELQSYFITRIEKFLNAKGRQIIGWDEILEGGLAPNAAVMSWRGEKGGIEAAKSHHPVVMTPTSHCYFDYYQGDTDLEPKAFDGKLTLSRVYSYNPVPKELTKEEAKFVMGVQANLWTEQVPTPEHAEYMIFPRITALSEVAWSSLENKNWDSFSTRLLELLKRYDILEINYARSAFNVRVNSKIDPKTKTFGVTLIPELLVGEVRYTTDGSDPSAKSTKYTKQFIIDKTVKKIKAAQFLNGKRISKISFNNFTINKASFKTVKFNIQPHKKYLHLAQEALTNSTFGGTNFGDGNWIGFEKDDLDVVIDLEKELEINELSLRTLNNLGAYVFPAQQVEFYISLDNKNFTHIKTVKPSSNIREAKTGAYYFTAKEILTQARYIRVVAKNTAICPDWHNGHGAPAWLFVDEIIVN